MKDFFLEEETDVFTQCSLLADAMLNPLPALADFLLITTLSVIG